MLARRAVFAFSTDLCRGGGDLVRCVGDDHHLHQLIPVGPVAASAVEKRCEQFHRCPVVAGHYRLIGSQGGADVAVTE